MRLALIVTLPLVWFLSSPVAGQDWEPAIRAFETQDAKSPPAKHGILFVGSSSIRFWKTDSDLPGQNIINRGFGGSQTGDVLEYMDRIVLPYEPRLIVYYAGDNDIAAGKTPEEVIANTETFVDRVHESLPDTRIVYIAIKPSLARWTMIEDMRAVNARMAETANNDDRLEFVDIDTPMIGQDGKPRAQLFLADGLHLNDAGYALWNELIRPYLEKTSDD